jgi:hypothetical protein
VKLADVFCVPRELQDENTWIGVVTEEAWEIRCELTAGVDALEESISGRFPRYARTAFTSDPLLDKIGRAAPTDDPMVSVPSRNVLHHEIARDNRIGSEETTFEEVARDVLAKEHGSSNLGPSTNLRISTIHGISTNRETGKASGRGRDPALVAWRALCD